MFLEVLHNVFDQVAGYREPDPHIAAGVPGDDSGVDADHLASRVEKRTAAVARIDGCVGLDKLVIGTGTNISLLGAHDSRRHSMGKPERVTDGDHQLPDLQSVGIPERQMGQFCFLAFILVDLDQRDIGFRIRPNEFRGEIPVVLQGYPDLTRLIDYMMVGKNMSFLVDQKSRSHSASGMRPGTLERLKPFLEKIRSFPRPVFRKFRRIGFELRFLRLQPNAYVDHRGVFVFSDVYDHIAILAQHAGHRRMSRIYERGFDKLKWKHKKRD